MLGELLALGFSNRFIVDFLQLNDPTLVHLQTVYGLKTEGGSGHSAKKVRH